MRALVLVLALAMSAIPEAALLLFAVPACAGDVTDTWKKRADFRPAGTTSPAGRPVRARLLGRPRGPS